MEDEKKYEGVFGFIREIRDKHLALDIAIFFSLTFIAYRLEGTSSIGIALLVLFFYSFDDLI